MKFAGQQHNGDDGREWPRQWVEESGKPQGVALVATLIMLSLVTFMTVAFLGVARRERRGMEVHLSQGDARNFMYAGLSAAQTEIIARLLSPQGRSDRPDPWSYSLMVSTNYMWNLGFSNSSSIIDVNDFDAMEQALNPAIPNAQDRWLRYLANLQILPRAPVFDPAYTNGWNDRIDSLFGRGAKSIEGRLGRFFLDFNRNRQFEPTFSRGLMPTNGGGIQKYAGGVFHSIHGIGHSEWFDLVPAFYSNFFGHYVGDPQWIGILQDPNRPHGPSNQFIGRYAFLVMPAGKSLDINNIHNQNKLYNADRPPGINPDLDGYTRNDGVGSWEINLAAFIAALNTNQNAELHPTASNQFRWIYGNYTPFNAAPTPALSGDIVHQEAIDILRYRMNTNMVELKSMENWLGGPGIGTLRAQYLTASAADLAGQFYPSNYGEGKRLPYFRDTINLPWIGATNQINKAGGDTNTDVRFQTINDIFTEGSLFDRFRNHLRSHSQSHSNFNLLGTVAEQVRALDDRYTFYRMISQMGTYSKPPEGKINLNWDTGTADGNWAYPDEGSRVTNGMYAPWTPLHFFTNVAQVLIDSSIKTNVSLDPHPEDPPFGSGPAIGHYRYITNYTLGSLTSFDGSNQNFAVDYDRFTLVGRRSRFKSSPTADWQPALLGWTYRFPDTNLNAFVVKTNHTLPLTNITVFPFNQYTPVLHRLLQVAANLHETAGNSREWVPGRSYPAGALVRRYGRYYECTSGGNTADPFTGSGWAEAGPGLPHVFRPVFSYKTNGVAGATNAIYISEWLEVTNALYTNITYLDVNSPADRLILSNATVNGTHYNYTLKGFPLIIGAKGPVRNSPSATGGGSIEQEMVASGIPNFNELAIKAIFSITRKLELTKTNASDPLPSGINTMYILGLRTAVGAEAWNPYRYVSYPRDLELQITNVMTVLVENEYGPVFTNVFVQSNVTLVPGGTWAGAQGAVEFTGQPATSHPSFRTLLDNQEWKVPIPPSVYFPPAYSNFAGIGTNGALLPLRTNNFATDFRRTNLFPAMQLSLTLSNWLVYTAVDKRYNRIVDHVNLTNLTTKIDLMALISQQITNAQGTIANAAGQYFDTNLVQSPFPGSITNLMPAGLVRQITHSMTLLVSNGVANRNAIRDWRAFDPGANNVAASIQAFRNFVGRGTGSGLTAMFAPYSPTIVAEQDVRFEVNDPIVHYLTSDLIVSRTNLTDGQDTTIVPGINVTNLNDPVVLRQQFGLPKSIGRLNAAYRPWGGNPTELTFGRKAFSEHFNMGLKDPGVHFAEDWDFPERKFGTIGWMGRVHRGTPWQTIYMKSRVVSAAEWRDWGQDPDTHPTNDWNLFDNLTAHPNRKAASGLLGINQTNFAAWAAVLGGLNYTFAQQLNGRQIQPTLNNGLLHPTANAVRRIHAGIVRSRHENYSFTRLGQILSVPELSCGSPVISHGVSAYSEGSSVNPGIYRVHRGIRWLSQTNITPFHPQPPSVREHQLPVFLTAQDMLTFINTNNGVDANTYVWYRDPSQGLKLYYSVYPTWQIPVSNSVVTTDWAFSPWREAQQDPLQEEAFGMEESMVERIPQKIMGLLRRDPHPRLVVYAFGQALEPAEQSKYMFPGPYYGMVTNYRVVSEVSSRTVLRVEGIPEPGLIPFSTNASAVVFPRIVIEDHKLLGRE